MQEILISATLLTAMLVGLTLLVLLARRLLGASGSVRIRIGEDQVIESAAGRRLLWALADAGIHLPAACGGKGACGQCRVRIEEGQPGLSPMDAEHIGPRDAERGFRLACMVRTWQDMRIAIDPAILDSASWDCEVASSRSVSVYLKELRLRLPAGQRIAFRAGDYVQVTVPPYRLDFADIHIDPPFDAQWRRLGLFALGSESQDTTIRAYSMANAPHEDREVRLVVRIATPPATAPVGTPPGRASSWLFSLAPGDRLSVSGPYGDFHASESDRDMVLIAGGAGIAPMRSIVLDQLARRTGRRISLWYGARDRHDLCFYDEFLALAEQHDEFDIHAVLSTPAPGDGWAGATGFVHAVVHERFLAGHPDPGAMEYYLCGPPVMATAVIDMLNRLGVPPGHVFVDDFGA